MLFLGIFVAFALGYAVGYASRESRVDRRPRVSEAGSSWINRKL